MKKKLPKFNLGFTRDGLTMNSKKFHPLNMSFLGHRIESDQEYKTIDAMEILDSLSSIDTNNSSNIEKLGVLKNMIQKVLP